MIYVSLSTLAQEQLATFDNPELHLLCDEGDAAEAEAEEAFWLAGTHVTHTTNHKDD